MCGEGVGGGGLKGVARREGVREGDEGRGMRKWGWVGHHSPHDSPNPHPH